MAVVIKIKDEQASILAESSHEEKALLLEGCWYYKPEQVNLNYLKKTERIYKCPYKGTAYWYDLDTPTMKAKNIAWAYEEPMDGYEHIAGLIAFYDRETSATISEKLDTEKA